METNSTEVLSSQRHPLHLKRALDFQPGDMGHARAEAPGSGLAGVRRRLADGGGVTARPARPQTGRRAGRVRLRLAVRRRHQGRHRPVREHFGSPEKNFPFHCMPCVSTQMSVEYMCRQPMNSRTCCLDLFLSLSSLLSLWLFRAVLYWCRTRNSD